MADPLDVVSRLLALAAVAEIGAVQLDKKRIARLARDAAEEISHLRRRLDDLHDFS